MLYLEVIIDPCPLQVRDMAGSHVWRGLRHAGMAVAGTDQDPGDVRDTVAEWKHFFVIFVLPFVLLTLGMDEYRLIKKSLHPIPGISQTAVIEDAEQPLERDK